MGVVSVNGVDYGFLKLMGGMLGFGFPVEGLFVC